MSIVCGTDFSDPAERAATAAAYLALRMNEPLYLVHSLDASSPAVSGSDREAMTRLARETERLHDLGADVHAHVRMGAPDDTLPELARELSARLIVAPHGGANASPLRLGRHADQTAQSAQVPILVVRDAEPFAAWSEKARPLRVVLEVEPSRSSEAAARWLGELCSRGPCEVVLAHVYSPPDESYRLGLRGDLEHPGPEVLDAFRRECSARFARLFGSATLAYRVEPHAGRAGEALVLLAARERADVVVAGYHEGSVLARIWKGSIARSVLESSHSSAVCVPAPTEPSTLPAAKVRSVLVATDFSSAGDGAIPLAYSVVANGGTVHLVHVLISNELFAPADIFSPVGHGSSAEAAVARDRLLELAPHDRRGSAASTCIHVLQSSQPATAIRQAAERLAVDVICLGTRGRTRLAKIALGSVAEDVLANSRRPVLLARGPKD